MILFLRELNTTGAKNALLSPLTKFFLLSLLLLFVSCSRGDSVSNNPVLQVGQTAPDFKLNSLDGTATSLSHYRGKLVFLNFWATWCAPCIKEMPSIERLYAAFKDKGLEVVAVDLDPVGVHDNVAEFVRKFGLSFPIALDPELSVPDIYGVERFPETFFISPEGNIIAVNDPDSGRRVISISSDRPWDSEVYFEFIQNLLSKYSSDTYTDKDRPVSNS